MKKVLIIGLVLSFAGLSSAWAQTGVEGQVTDVETGEPLPGATVQVEGTETGTATGPDGSYQLTGLEPGTHTLAFSFVGYQETTEEVEVVQGEMTTLDVEMETATQELEEMVVTGYAVQPRREVTGAISRVEAEDFRLRNIQTPDQALQGQSAGVQFVSASGQPGSDSHIRIRGTGSINSGNAPLYIVDGVQMEDNYRAGEGSTGVLQSLDPNDIESIEVLRDAEATSIYGAQGANGVVLITTREGAEGPTQFSFTSRLNASEQDRYYELADGPTWVEYMAEAYANRYEDLGNDPEEGRQEAYENLGHPNEVGTYDWPNAMLQRGIGQRYNLSARGGTENTQFYLSGGYTNQEGTVINSVFERANLRANIDHQANDRLSFETKINLSRSVQTGFAEGGGNWINSPFHGGVTTRVTAPIYDEDDPTGYNQNPTDLSGVSYNNVQLLHDAERRGREMQLVGTLSALYMITDHLNLRGQFNADYRMSKDRRYDNAIIPRYQNNYGGRVFERSRENENWSGNVVFNYNRSFEDVHNVSGLLGGEYRQRDYLFHSADGRQIPNPLLGQLNLAGEANAVAGRTSHYKTAGVFSRLQYNFDERYFISGSVRTDGHSRFGEDRRWGLFYSGSLAWDAAQEGFMQDLDWVNQLRLRTSYGITGNSDISSGNTSDFASRSLVGQGGTYEGSAGLRPAQLGNSLLTWEEAATLDLGVDFMFFDGRFYGEAGVYRTNNQELLLERWLPSDSGFGDIMENVGTVRNEGIELELGVIPIDYGDFSWRSDFNVTFQRSEVIELEGGREWMSDPNVDASRIIVGEPRHSWWVRNYAGVNPADGRAMFYDENGDLAYSVGSDDYFNAGSMIPDSYGGWNNEFAYGPVSLDVFFQFEFGSLILDEQYSNFHLAPHRERVLSPDIERRWTEPGQITDIPKLYTESAFPGGTAHNNWSDRRLFDGSYIRLKSISLEYQLPSRWAQQLSLNGLSMYVQSENLLTFTAYPGPDPEVFDRGQTFYPIPRSFEVGVDVNF